MSYEPKTLQILLSGGHNVVAKITREQDLLQLTQHLDQCMIQAVTNNIASLVSVGASRFISSCIIGYVIHDKESLVEQHLKEQIELNKRVKKQLDDGESWRYGKDEDEEL